MEQLGFMSVLGVIALIALALTIFIPLVIAIRHCRRERRRKLDAGG
jgi:predicted RND superfamily exporter protein